MFMKLTRKQCAYTRVTTLLHTFTYIYLKWCNKFWIVESFQPTVEKAQLHALHGDQLIQSNHYAVDSIRPKCVELRRVCDDFSNEAKKKTDVLSKSLQIHVGIDKVSTFTHITHQETR